MQIGQTLKKAEIVRMNIKIKYIVSTRHNLNVKSLNKRSTYVCIYIISEMLILPLSS